MPVEVDDTVMNAGSDLRSKSSNSVLKKSDPLSILEFEKSKKLSDVKIKEMQQEAVIAAEKEAFSKLELAKKILMEEERLRMDALAQEKQEAEKLRDQRMHNQYQKLVEFEKSRLSKTDFATGPVFLKAQFMDSSTTLNQTDDNLNYDTSLSEKDEKVLTDAAVNTKANETRLNGKVSDLIDESLQPVESAANQVDITALEDYEKSANQSFVDADEELPSPNIDAYHDEEINDIELIPKSKFAFQSLGNEAKDDLDQSANQSFVDALEEFPDIPQEDIKGDTSAPESDVVGPQLETVDTRIEDAAEHLETRGADAFAAVDEEVMVRSIHEERLPLETAENGSIAFSNAIDGIAEMHESKVATQDNIDSNSTIQMESKETTRVKSGRRSINSVGLVELSQSVFRKEVHYVKEGIDISKESIHFERTEVSTVSEERIIHSLTNPSTAQLERTSMQSLLCTETEIAGEHPTSVNYESGHHRNRSAESTVVLVDGVFPIYNPIQGISLDPPISNQTASKLAQPSYSEFFDTDKINSNSIRLRTDLNEIMNSFNLDVSTEIPFLRYSQELDRNEIRKRQEHVRRSRKCDIL